MAPFPSPRRLQGRRRDHRRHKSRRKRGLRAKLSLGVACVDCLMGSGTSWTGHPSGGMPSCHPRVNYLCLPIAATSIAQCNDSCVGDVPGSGAHAGRQTVWTGLMPAVPCVWRHQYFTLCPTMVARDKRRLLISNQVPRKLRTINRHFVLRVVPFSLQSSWLPATGH
jgi:hypothetical protein